MAIRSTLSRATVVLAALLLGGTVAASPAGAGPPSPTGHDAGATGRGVHPGSALFTPPPDPDAVRQIVDLARHGKLADAARITAMVTTPQAVWLTGGTPAEVERTVRKTVALAAATRTVPVFVAYDLPFRDCGQYSAGGATDTASYLAWINGVARGIGSAKAVVLLEPDGLGIIPYNTDVNGNLEWCTPDLTGTGLTPETANEARYTQLNGAVDRLETQPGASVYLDGTNSAWLGVGDIAGRLVKAGVADAQGFFANVSNYRTTSDSTHVSTWISECIAFGSNGPDWAAGHYEWCASQYYSPAAPNDGSPGGAVDANDPSTWGWTDLWFEQNLGSTPATTHFVIDTSRNGRGPADMSVYGAAPYHQSPAVVATLQAGNWCNAPGAGLGLRPTTTTGVPLLDAYLWVKTPGQSDGQCDSAGGVRAWDYSVYSRPGWPTAGADQALFDPLWGTVSPAAGAWFGDQAIQLARNATPALFH